MASPIHAHRFSPTPCCTDFSPPPRIHVGKIVPNVMCHSFHHFHHNGSLPRTTGLHKCSWTPSSMHGMAWCGVYLHISIYRYISISLSLSIYIYISIFTSYGANSPPHHLLSIHPVHIHAYRQEDERQRPMPMTAISASTWPLSPSHAQGCTWNV